MEDSTLLITDPNFTVGEMLLSYRATFPNIAFSRSDIRFIYSTYDTTNKSKNTVRLSKFLHNCWLYDIRRRINLYPTIKAQLTICGIEKISITVTDRIGRVYFYLSKRNGLYDVRSTDSDRNDRVINDFIVDLEQNRGRWM